MKYMLSAVCHTLTSIMLFPIPFKRDCTALLAGGHISPGASLDMKGFSRTGQRTHELVDSLLNLHWLPMLVVSY
jgi:hypothetical protein